MNGSEWLRLVDSAVVRRVSFGAGGISLLAPDALEPGQVGYAVDPSGRSLVGSASGDWRESWYVIGRDELAGGPLFLDLARPGAPVLTAEHGMGEWDPVQIADSAERFLQILQLLQAVASGREHPVALAANPLPDAERDRVLAKIGDANPGADLFYWSSFLDD